MRTAGPATQPNWAIAHASDNTPDPITAVIICALAVNKVPSIFQNQTQKYFSSLIKKKKKERNVTKY